MASKLLELSPLLNEDMKQHLLPIYQDLSRDDLLERCLGGHTQNANERFNSTIWRISPKHLNCGQKIIEISAYFAAGVFNDGFSSILRIMNSLDIIVGTTCRVFAEAADEPGIVREDRRSLSATKAARMGRRMQLAEENQFFEEAEGLLHAPGITDLSVSHYNQYFYHVFFYNQK